MRLSLAIFSCHCSGLVRWAKLDHKSITMLMNEDKITIGWLVTKLTRKRVKMNESLTTKKRRTQLNEAHQRGSNCPVFSKLDFSSSFILASVCNELTTIKTAKTRFVLPLQHLQLLQLPHQLQQLRCKPQVKLLMMGPSGWPQYTYT